MAQRLIRPMEQVTQKLIEEEQGNAAKMAVGIEPRMPEDGIDAPQTRLQALQDTIARSQRLATLYAADPMFRALVENRQKFLMQQFTQQSVNPVVGRLGTMPLQGNQEAAMAVGMSTGEA
jgi:hypothetical protein